MAGHDEADEVAAQGLGEGLAGRAVGDRADQGFLVAGVLVEDQGLFAVREVVEQGRHGHVGALGDLADAHLLVAALQEQPQCRVGDRLAGGGLLALAPPARSCPLDRLRHARKSIRPERKLEWLYIWSRCKYCGARWAPHGCPPARGTTPRL